jgi:tetratricopeptide (TPR) repeat protein
MAGPRLDWNAAVLLDRTVPNERDRNRIAAGAGLLFVMAGLLFAIGLGVIVLGAIVLALAYFGGRYAVRTIRAHADARRAGEALRSIGERAKPLARTSAERLRTVTEHAVAEAQATKAKLGTPAPTRSRDRHRLQKEALRLNTAGSDARRKGEPQRAAELHAEALAVVRELGDRVAEALTLNNLALALGAAGDTDGAIARFVEAHAVACDLDEPKYEGLIAANLATAYRRRGYEQQAVEFLHVALQKLPPSSGAYRQVEEELQRAS